MLRWWIMVILSNFFLVLMGGTARDHKGLQGDHKRLKEIVVGHKGHQGPSGDHKQHWKYTVPIYVTWKVPWRTTRMGHMMVRFWAFFEFLSLTFFPCTNHLKMTPKKMQRNIWWFEHLMEDLKYLSIPSGSFLLPIIHSLKRG